MKRKTLDRAIADARRFIEAADAIRRADIGTKDLEYVPYSTPTKFTAAAKRASMDLTRTLADLRQGR